MKHAMILQLKISVEMAEGVESLLIKKPIKMYLS